MPASLRANRPQSCDECEVSRAITPTSNNSSSAYFYFFSVYDPTETGYSVYVLHFKKGSLKIVFVTKHEFVKPHFITPIQTDMFHRFVIFNIIFVIFVYSCCSLDSYIGLLALRVWPIRKSALLSLWIFRPTYICV